MLLGGKTTNIYVCVYEELFSKRHTKNTESKHEFEMPMTSL